MAATRLPNIDEHGNFVNPEVLARLSERFGGGSGVPSPLGDYLEAGELLPNDGTTDAQPLFQRAVDSVAAAVAFTGPRKISVPAGSYRLDAQILWATGVGMKGAGRHETVLLPHGNRSAIEGNQSGMFDHFYDDCVFEDFTIDAANQSADPADSWAKGFFIQWMRRGRFERVSVKNTWMTGFGVDYLQDVTFSQCYAENCGRGGTSTTGAGAGFGFATGVYDTESISVVDCVSINNKTHGFFTESNPIHNKHPKGFRLVGCYASGNHSGFNDGGSNGATVTGCQFVNNTDSGVYLAKTPANSSSGGEGIITGCNLSNNGVAGVKIREFIRGGYTIAGNTITGNGVNGIVRDTPGGAVLDIPESLVIRGNVIKDHPESAILFKTTSRVVRPVIVDNDIINSGTNTAATNRDGITCYGPVDYATIRDNRIYDTGPATTQNAVWLRGTVTTLSPVIQGNDCAVALTPAVRIGHTVADQQYITGNIERAPLPPSVAWSDDFNRSDGPLTGTTTATGDQTWTRIGTAGTPQILANQHAVPDATGNVMSLVNNGVADGTFTAAAAVLGAESLAQLVFRTKDVGNYIGIKGRTTSADRRWTLIKRVGNTETVIASLDAPATPGDVLSVTATGTDVTVNVNGVERWTGSITEHATETLWGLYSSPFTLEARWDDLAFTTA